MPRGDISKFIAAEIYGAILPNRWGPTDLPVPTDAWVERRDRDEPKSQDSSHLDSEAVVACRKVWGYIGHVRKLNRSGNTDHLWLLTIAIKLALPPSKGFTNLGNLSICFAPIGAFAAAWAPIARNPGPPDFAPGGAIAGIVLARRVTISIRDAVCECGAHRRRIGEIPRTALDSSRVDPDRFPLSREKFDALFA